MHHTLFQWGTSQEARAQVILAGLKNPTLDVSRAIEEVEVAGKVRYPHSSHTFLESIRAFYFISSPNTHITFNVFHLFTGADEQPADNLTEVAALDIDNLLTKTSDISKGVLYNVQQTLLKECSPDSFGVLPEDTMQELLTGVTSIFQVYIIHYPF